MLVRAKDLIGRHVNAAGEDVGKMRDIYFDDTTWNVRYFVVDTGGWLDRNEVLLAPTAFPDWDVGSDELRTSLTRERVENSPPVASDMPVSRQYEQRLHDYYGWAPYWQVPITPAAGLYMYPAVPVPPPVDERSEPRQPYLDVNQDGDPHLRSFSEVKGYRILARDGEIGHVDDLLIDDRTHRVTHVIVDTRNWLPGRHVVVDAGVCTKIAWDESRVHVSLSKEAIRQSPEYDDRRAIDEEYQGRLSSYYRGIGDTTGPTAGL
jgi:uncharacterized protein YrrD